LRNQAIGGRRKGRRRTVRSASSFSPRKVGLGPVRWVLHLIPGLVYLFVLILAAWLLYYSIASPYFLVSQVVVSGSRLLSQDQVRDAAAVLGQNALLLRADAVAESVRRIVVVRDTRAAVTLPGRVEIAITERTPLVQWQAREGSFQVDREGVVFSREAPLTPVTLVRDLDGPAMEVGSQVDPGVLDSIKMLEAALPSRAGIQVDRFDFSRSTGISVPLEGGPRIVFGDASDLDSKLGTLAAIRKHLEAGKSKAEVIDLRFKGRPVYVLAPSVSAGSSQSRP